MDRSDGTYPSVSVDWSLPTQPTGAWAQLWVEKKFLKNSIVMILQGIFFFASKWTLYCVKLVCPQGGGPKIFGQKCFEKFLDTNPHAPLSSCGQTFFGDWPILRIYLKTFWPWRRGVSSRRARALICDLLFLNNDNTWPHMTTSCANSLKFTQPAVWVLRCIWQGLSSALSSSSWGSEVWIERTSAVKRVELIKLWSGISLPTRALFRSTNWRVDGKGIVTHTAWCAKLLLDWVAWPFSRSAGRSVFRVVLGYLPQMISLCSVEFLSHLNWCE